MISHIIVLILGWRGTCCSNRLIFNQFYLVMFSEINFVVILPSHVLANENEHRT